MYNTPKIESVEIAGVTIRIERDTYRVETEDEADGLYCNKIIYLREKYKDKNEYRRVYFHECIHALCDILGAQMDDTAEEMLVNMISYLGIQVLK